MDYAAVMCIAFDQHHPSRTPLIVANRGPGKGLDLGVMFHKLRGGRGMSNQRSLTCDFMKASSCYWNRRAGHAVASDRMEELHAQALRSARQKSSGEGSPFSTSPVLRFFDPFPRPPGRRGPSESRGEFRASREGYFGGGFSAGMHTV